MWYDSLLVLIHCCPARSNFYAYWLLDIGIRNKSTWTPSDICIIWFVSLNRNTGYLNPSTIKINVFWLPQWLQSSFYKGVMFTSVDLAYGTICQSPFSFFSSFPYPYFLTLSPIFPHDGKMLAWQRRDNRVVRQQRVGVGDSVVLAPRDGHSSHRAAASWGRWVAVACELV